MDRWNLGLAGMFTLAMWVRCSRGLALALMPRRKEAKMGTLMVSGLLLVVNQLLQGGRTVLFLLLIAAFLVVAERPMVGTPRDNKWGWVMGVLLAGAWLAWSFLLLLAGVGGMEVARVGALYVLTSWNRAAAIMSGGLTLTREGSGERVLSWLYYFPGLNSQGWRERIAGVDVRSPVDAWVEKFEAIGRAGLDPAFTWTRIFGSVYVDMGWSGVSWFAVYGALMGCVRSLSVRSVGVFCLYVWVMGSIAAWLGANEIMIANPVTVSYVAGVIYGELVVVLAGVIARARVGRSRAS